MKELKNIISEYEKLEEKDCALATVVKVRGSAYRSPGARMLIRKDGRWIGSISGGCLEGDALRKARNIMREGKPQLVTYDTMDDDANSLGVGLGCNGIIDVLIEPIVVEDNNNPIERLKRLLPNENPVMLSTVFQSSSLDDMGRQMWLEQDGVIKGDIRNDGLKKEIQQYLKATAVKGKPSTQYFPLYKAEVFFEILEPSIDLVIFGGGFDAKPVTALATSMGWDVTVTDECVAHISPVNFPDANVSFCKRGDLHKDIRIKPYTAAVLMSHTFDYDLDALIMLLKTDVQYIGVLGPKKRMDKMLKQLEEDNIYLSAMDKERLHSPIGIDIGAETPEEVALSIIAEIQAKFRNRGGGFLKYRQSPIHQRRGADDQVFRHVYMAQKSGQGQHTA